ncbi:DUF559 domain-containing protein [Nocardioides sp. LS1]|uniref:DUF559 domain-containing protein n=1 Tax=Nocardioides sp. LS1 TaxID=1027620 RepID=UPI000F627BCA|nr:DUF559 domain-containing protein [Nocardioides sp. LS1]GCD89830.1 hypothetical protein NLS1_18360 [Nocardioides sp. LS1]
MESIWPAHPFTLAALRERGLRPSDVRRGLRRGELSSPLRGVYLRSDVPDTLELRVAAVAQVVTPHHVVTDRTAAWLHGVDVHSFAEHDVPLQVEVCALRWHEPTSLPGVDGRTRDLAPDDVMTVHGLRVTTPLRTALDLGCCLRRREAFGAMVALAHEHGLTRAELLRELARRYGRRRGVIQARRLAALVDPRIESQREAWVFLEIAEAGLALPEPQVWIEVDGVPTFRLDFAYRRARVAVEYDGEEAHEGSDQREYDERRRAWLRAHGWTVIVVRAGDFTGDALTHWLQLVSEALRSSYTTRRW